MKLWIVRSDYQLFVVMANSADKAKDIAIKERYGYYFDEYGEMYDC